MKNKRTVQQLLKMKQEGEKIACLTAYDASFARLLDDAGVDLLLVGDSLGMVLHGRENTLEVTVNDIIYHTRQVSRGATRAMVVADMPFMSYTTPAQALGNAARMLSEGGAQMVKLEGGENAVEIVRHLSRFDIPVCGHLGLKPQSVNKYGGYRVQGREQEDAEQMVQDAVALQEAGAMLLVLECIPARLAAEISRTITIPTIGIGAGVECDGQILVLYDILGISMRSPHLARDFMEGRGTIRAAVDAYVAAVKNGTFPGAENSFD